MSQDHNEQIATIATKYVKECGQLRAQVSRYHTDARQALVEDPELHMARDLAECGGWCAKVLERILLNVASGVGPNHDPEHMRALDNSARALLVWIEDWQRTHPQRHDPNPGSAF